MSVFIFLKEYLKSKYKYIKKEHLIIFLMSILLSILVFVFSNDSIFVSKNKIMRAGYGLEKDKYELSIDVDGLVKNENIVFEISDRKYKKSEIDEIVDEAYEECVLKVLNNNTDFDHIDSDLLFFTRYKEGIDIEWNFRLKENSEISLYKKYYNLVSDTGKLNNEILDEDLIEGYIEFCFKACVEGYDRKYKTDMYSIPITIYKKQVSHKEEIIKKIMTAIDINDKDNIVLDNVVLPDEIESKKIKYKEKKDLTFLFIPVIAVIVILLLNLKKKVDVKEKEKIREKELLITYPKLITKLLIYVEASMTVKNSLIKIASDYENRLKNNATKNNVLYDLLIIAKNKLEYGASESVIYRELSSSINNQKYSRFFNLLNQNVKNGSKELIAILRLEASDSLIEMKNNAKKQGEEASTKLIVPLLLELMIVMFVIIVPAFMGI